MSINRQTTLIINNFIKSLINVVSVKTTFYTDFKNIMVLISVDFYFLTRVVIIWSY